MMDRLNQLSDRALLAYLTSETSNIGNFDSYPEGFVKALIEASDRLDDLIIYDIGQKDDNHGTSYNGNKINVTYDTSIPSTLKISGFRKYKHKPLNFDQNTKRCVIYNNDFLFGRTVVQDTQSVELKGIQGTIFSGINVYWTSDNVSEPLLIEVRKTSYNQNQFYYHTWDSNGLYWKQIPKSGDALGVKFEGQDVYTQLSTGSYDKLLQLLFSIKNHLQKTLVFIVDRKTPYNKKNINSFFVSSEKWRLIENDINPAKKTDSTEGKCLSGTGFNAYEHNFSELVKKVKDSSERISLRFILPSTGGEYNEITLVNDNGVYQSTLSYQKGKNDSLYVFFYEDEDPRPLLICYEGKSYRPKKIADSMADKQLLVDYTKWVNVNDINNCICKGFQGLSELDSKNEPLLNALSEVVGYLNPVELNPTKIDELSIFLEESKRISPNSATYTLHTYSTTQTIKIKITSLNLRGYKKYTYEPNGTSGNKEGFTLGNVVYSENHKKNSHHLKLSNSDNKYRPFTWVEAYYQFSNHTHPILIVLGFKDNREEYYKLKDKDKYEWEYLESSNEDKDTLDRLKKNESIEKVLNEIITDHPKQHVLGNPSLSSNTSVRSSYGNNLYIEPEVDYLDKSTLSSHEFVEEEGQNPSSKTQLEFPVCDGEDNVELGCRKLSKKTLEEVEISSIPDDIVYDSFENHDTSTSDSEDKTGQNDESFKGKDSNPSGGNVTQGDDRSDSDNRGSSEDMNEFMEGSGQSPLEPKIPSIPDSPRHFETPVIKGPEINENDIKQSKHENDSIPKASGTDRGQNSEEGKTNDSAEPPKIFQPDEHVLPPKNPESKSNDHMSYPHPRTEISQPELGTGHGLGGENVSVDTIPQQFYGQRSDYASLEGHRNNLESLKTENEIFPIITTISSHDSINSGLLIRYSNDMLAGVLSGGQEESFTSSSESSSGFLPGIEQTNTMGQRVTNAERPTQQKRMASQVSEVDGSQDPDGPSPGSSSMSRAGLDSAAVRAHDRVSRGNFSNSNILPTNPKTLDDGHGGTGNTGGSFTWWPYAMGGLVTAVVGSAVPLYAITKRRNIKNMTPLF